MEYITDLFVDYLYELSKQEVPRHIWNKAKDCLKDYLGVTYAGAVQDNNAFQQMISKSVGPVPLIGMEGITVDAYTAALINGYHAHMLELDDGHRFGMIHLGAVIISALFSITVWEEMSLSRMLKGIVLGYEAAVRIAMSIQPEHKKKGFHATATCGTIGAAVGGAILLGCTKEQLKTAISAAATSAAGLLKVQEDDSRLKAYNAAHGAMMGVVSAYTGMTDLQGPRDVLGGDRGFLALHSDVILDNKLTGKANSYEIERIYVKPYASCRHCHPAMEAAIWLAEHYQVPIQQIEKITITIYSAAIYGHDHTKVEGVESAKLSIPYCVAMAYVYQDGSVELFDENKLEDDRILELVKKIVIKEDKKFTEEFPQKRISEICICTNDKQEFKKRIDYAKGEPENPLSSEEITDKFLSLMNWAGAKKKGELLLARLDERDIYAHQLFL